MLILSRKLNESIIIDGRIIVKVLRIDKDTVKLGIQAPPELAVHREEVHEAILRNKQQSNGGGPYPKDGKSGQSSSAPAPEGRPPESRIKS